MNTPQELQQPSGVWNKFGTVAAVLIAIFVMAISIYRAKHLAITHDEALTYDLYLQRRFYDLFKFDANDHVLYSLIAFCSVRLFGLTEMSLRLPALAAAAFYLAFNVLICRRLFYGIWICLGVGLLSLNPIMLDYLSIARGYGPANAFFMCALYLGVRLVDERIQAATSPPARRLSFWISVNLAVAVCANLTFAIPGAALFLMLVAITFSVHRDWKAVRIVALQLMIPGAIIALGMLWPFLPQLRKDQFYIGETSLWQSVVQLTSASFLYKQTARIGIGRRILSDQTVHFEHLTAVLAVILLIVLFARFTAEAYRMIFVPLASRAQTRFILLAGTMFMSVAIYLTLHAANGMKFPVARTGIYFTPLLTLSVGAWAMLANRSKLGSMRFWAATSLSSIALASYLLELQVSFTHYARYDAGDRAAIGVVTRDHDADPWEKKLPFRVGGSWIYESSMNFYRKSLGIALMRPYERNIPANPRDYDYFVYNPVDYKHLDNHDLKVLWTDPISGTVVAKVLTKNPAPGSPSGTPE